MIKLAKPFIPEKAINAVVEVLKSGNLVQGKYVKQFEKKLEEYLNVENAVVVSSGTAALHLALMALEIGQGDEVIVPAFTFPATANVVELVGAKPVFVDITLDDFCIDTSKIEEVITKRTKVIMPVHEFGQAAKMDDILEISKKHNLKIIEDAACALGTEYDGKKAGTFGSAGCFSFHPRKAITTGEGGAIVTKDSVLAKKLRSLRNHGIDKVQNKIDFFYTGLNYRMTDFQAALGLYQLEIIDELINKRIEQAAMYDSLLSDTEWIKTPSIYSDRKMVYQTYHVLLNNNIDRNKFIRYLQKEGIETNIGAQAVHLQSYYSLKYSESNHQLNNARNAFLNGFALPIGIHLIGGNIKHIASQLTQFQF